MMNILVVSFYYPPDLCAGSFRAKATVEALIRNIPKNSHIDIVTTMPNRYHSFKNSAQEIEYNENVTIYRVKLPSHKSGMIDQARSFFSYARYVKRLVKGKKYDVVYGTSSRLMTATLSVYIANKKKVPVFLDIRDIFLDTISDILNPFFAFFVRMIFSRIEHMTFSRANHINLVSRGFENYFKSKYSYPIYSYHSNGIDEEFVENNNVEPQYDLNKKKVILYAGNIGESQGLHKIIPELAKRLEEEVQFRIIGDGGRKQQLLNSLTDLHANNVEVITPLKRKELVIEYQKADILFVHLNDQPAFKKVLPSKIFEYGATGKPILAGVSGYAAEFIVAELNNAVVFDPCKVEQAYLALERLRIKNVNRNEFISKYSRSKIMNQMAKDIIGVKGY